MSFEIAIAEEIWSAKYRFLPTEGAGDSSFGATSARVAKAVAQAEAPALRPQWQARFEEAIRDFHFIPAGRVLAGAGTERSVTLFNCFVMGTVPDSLDGIFEHLKEAAVTMQQGGGVGLGGRPDGGDDPAGQAVGRLHAGRARPGRLGRWGIRALPVVSL